MTLFGFIENVGLTPFDVGGTTAAADPQLQFFENFPGHLGTAFVNDSGITQSLQAINIPLSLSFNTLAFLFSHTSGAGSTRSMTWSVGLYSLNGATLSLENSVSRSATYGDATAPFWVAMTAVSKTQNITPGTWYLGFLKSASGDALDDSYYGNSSINPANAIPGGFLIGRVTASSGGLYASIATSDLDITGSDAIRQPYFIITA